MKHVVKGAAPQAFDDWKASATDNWTPSYPDLRNPEKAALHTALLAEQGHVCCCCGRRIALSDSHIEHFRPQEARADLALVYDNLLASCIRETRPGTPLHCGHAKGSEFDERLHVSPLDPGCEGRFQYTLNGQIQPTDPADAPAAQMQNVLKLEIAFLKNRRAQTIAQVFTAEFLRTVTREQLEKELAVYRSGNDQGQFKNFGHVLARFAEQRLAQMPPETQP